MKSIEKMGRLLRRVKGMVFLMRPCFFPGCLLLAAGCATTANYQARIVSWEGKNADSLIKAWGQPDANEKIGNGHRVLVYARLKHEPYAFNESPRGIASSDPIAGGIYVKCATYFEITPNNVIFSVMFSGDQCAWKD